MRILHSVHRCDSSRHEPCAVTLCKVDILLESLNRLAHEPSLDRDVLAFINVPAWVKGPRMDLVERLQMKEENNCQLSIVNCPLENPVITHELYNMDDDKALSMMRAIGLNNAPENRVKVIFVPCYLNGDDGIFNDVGVLVDDDGRVYCYYGYEGSHMNELDPESMYKVIPGSLISPLMDASENVPVEERFFEASSPRKVGDTYYLIYSPRKGSRLASVSYTHLTLPTSDLV